MQNKNKQTNKQIKQTNEQTKETNSTPLTKHIFKDSNYLLSMGANQNLGTFQELKL